MWKVTLNGSPFFPKGHEIVVEEKPTDEGMKEIMGKLMFKSYIIEEVQDEQ